MKSKKSTTGSDDTSKRIVRLERAVARHKREQAELREIISKAEVMATITANGVRTLVEKLVPPGDVTAASPSPRRKAKRKG